MKIGAAGIGLIRKYESLALKAYICPAGFPTIGWGHKITKGDRLGNEISLDQAEALLMADIAIAEAAVNALIKAPISQNQFDALVSFVFNLGADEVKASTLVQYVNANQHNLAAGQFGCWIFSKKKPLAGLIKRRADEALLFIKK